ncbi:unnamed protein product [Absidia cylindrospora]
MPTYWYSTRGVDQTRLSNRHLNLLDEAFERRTRVQLYDTDAFGHGVPAIANPYQGTMSAGDLHYGLYRQPSLAQDSDLQLDMSLLMECPSSLQPSLKSSTLLDSPRSRFSPSSAMTCRPLRSQHSTLCNDDDGQQSGSYSPPRRSPALYEDHCLCCIIS